MIRLDVEQGSPAWHAARLGLPTASQFHRIITPKKAELSGQAADYRNELIAEWLLGEPYEDSGSAFMERGSAEERKARKFYAMSRELEVLPGGLVLRDDRRCGCSPDGLIDPNGGLELKTPSAPVHVGYLLDGAGDKYRTQVQGGLWIAEREWWDFLSYNQVLPAAIVRWHRDDVFIAALSKAVAQFCDMLDAAKEELLSRGYTPRAPERPGQYVTLLEKLQATADQGGLNQPNGIFSGVG